MNSNNNTFTSIQRQILDSVQRNFPLVQKPYETLGEKLGLSEIKVIETIRQLKKTGIIRQISAIFNTSALGYKTSLVAMKINGTEVEKAAEHINTYPGVSHNYLRPAPYNVWFTIAVPPGDEIEDVVENLKKAVGSPSTIILPAIKKYKLAMVLDISGDEDNFEDDLIMPQLHNNKLFDLTPQNIKLVRCVQEDLPLDPKPFLTWAKQLGVTEDFLLGWLRSKERHAIIRRFAAVLDHRRAGFTANGMIVWHCPQEEVDRYGELMARQLEVTHCYHRPSHPDWPFNLYAMIHAQKRSKCLEIAERIAQTVDLRNYQVLFSTKEFKKIRLKLFWQ